MDTIMLLFFGIRHIIVIKLENNTEVLIHQK